jgi:hypothetical protein
MTTTSYIVDNNEYGVALDVTMAGFEFTAYLAVSEPDVNRASDIVPAERFEQDGDVHVAAIASPDDASSQAQDIVSNMNPGDCVVFLCADTPSYQAMLAVFGQQPRTSTTN